MALLEHGGGLRAAAAHYGIPLAEWLDLSTGINPHTYPVPELPASAWQRLPELNDGLEASAAAYYATEYGTESLLPVAGSQAAIQTLPRLFATQTIAVLGPTYSEHAAAWAAAGHQVSIISSLEAALGHANIVVLCNPNNPNGRLFKRDELSAASELLAAHNGYLIVDEAFMDASPEHSLAAQAGSALPNLIVLRSLGKFFGLAGARVGFVCAEPSLLKKLEDKLGPWALAHPSRFVATAALQNTAWQMQMRTHLPAAADRLAALLAPLGKTSGCALFQYLPTPQAAALHAAFAQRGILTRLFTEPAALRFGLPDTEPEWQRLEAAVQTLNTMKLEAE